MGVWTPDLELWSMRGGGVGVWTPDLELWSMRGGGVGVWTLDLELWSRRDGSVGVHQISNFGQCEVVAWVYTRSRTLVNVSRWCWCLDTRSRFLVNARLLRGCKTDLELWSMRGGGMGVHHISNFGHCVEVAWVSGYQISNFGH